jgi:signal transduction histidine kinase
LGRVGPLLDLSLGQLRTLVFELSPPVLYQAGLFAALDWLAGQLGGHWPVGYRCRLEGEPVALPDDLKVILFQGARELMTNVGRHARARTCAVVLSFERGVLRLAVEDDGVGIDAAPPPGPAQDRDRVRGAGGGFGLFSLRSRIELLGGGLQVRRGEAGGTRATLWVPLPGPVPEDRSGGAGRQGGGRSTNHFEDGDRSP